MPELDPDLAALWLTKAPEGRHLLEVLQRGRDRNRADLTHGPRRSDDLDLEAGPLAGVVR